jgi:hypothetical protein
MGLVLEQEAEKKKLKSTRLLNELEVRKSLVISVSLKSEELRLYNSHG